MIKQILILVLIFTITGCDFIKNSSKSKDTTKEFIESLIKEDYSKSLNYFEYQHNSDSVTDNMRQVLKTFREGIIKDFGTELDYSFMNSEKKRSANGSENTPPNTTLVFIQISNKRNFGVLKVYVDDNSSKIKDIYLLDVKEPIPSMTKFWLFGILALCVPVFIIYVLRFIKHSALRKKWVKYLAVILLNVPALTYSAVGGFSFSLLSFQILFGISINYMGYSNSAWTFGLPIGGIYWLWKLKLSKKKDIEIPIEINEINNDSTDINALKE